MYKLYIMITVVIVFIALYFVVSLSGNKAKNQFYEKGFNGVIKGLRFDEKGIPIVEINDTTINLGIDGIQIEELIQLNDSLVKKSKSFEYELYRKDSVSHQWKMIYGKI